MRNLRDNERNLIECLLNKSELSNINLENLQVEEMTDGGMGSLYFVNAEKNRNERRLGKRICERQFSDSDSIPILVSVNVDEAGVLFELDIWKVDFSRVIKFPECINADTKNG